jgi:hypothetical protein
MTGLKPPVSVPLNARVKIYRFSIQDAQLLAFERNIDYHMTEDLTQAGGNEALEKSIELRAVLSLPMHIYDLQHKKYLGQANQIQFVLDPWRPALFAVSLHRQSVETSLSE